MEIGGNYASAPADPFPKPLDGRAIFASMMSRFAGATPSCTMRNCSTDAFRRPTTARQIDTGPLSALDELRQHRQWVCWDYVTRPGATKPTKPPMSPHTGRGASHAKPADWGTYEQAEAMAARRKFAGVGFILSETDDYTGIDLDKCRDPATGKLDQWADDIVALGETYWEVSPSGTGLRSFVRGKIPQDGQMRHCACRGLSLASLPHDHRRPHRGNARGHPPRADDARMAHGARGAVRAGAKEIENHQIIKQEQLHTPQNACKGNHPTIPYFRAVNDKALADLSSGCRRSSRARNISRGLALFALARKPWVAT